VTDFASLGLAEPLLAALVEKGHTIPTPIQLQAIPPALLGRDVLGIAQTGTGKTAAFGLPILQALSKMGGRPARNTTRALILSPTRELASQIADSLRGYAGHLPISIATVFGGVGHGPQAKAIARGLDILVATPGRLLDHMGSGMLKLDGVSVFVLDEADQMLDQGFIHAIRRITPSLPRQRQTMFFSATFPAAISKLASDLLNDPVRVSVAPVATTAERVDQKVIFIDAGGKRALLTEMLRSAEGRTLVFSRTKHGADRVVENLEADGIPAAAIHGNKRQTAREAALAAFRAGTTRVLVATDIAARGIDVPGVERVVNFDLPNIPEQYVHRIGRTARAGLDGQAISFCTSAERAYLRDIQKLTRLEIPTEDRRRPGAPPDPAIDMSRPQGRPGQRPGGQRPSHGQGRPTSPAQVQGRPTSAHPDRSARPAGSARPDARRDGRGRDHLGGVGFMASNRKPARRSRAD